MILSGDARPCLREEIAAAWLADETATVRGLLPLAELEAAAKGRVTQRATRLVEAVRAARLRRGGLDAFLHEYDLSSEEGVVLMCLAEALLRIPDDATADRLIRDKLSHGDWRRHLGEGRSLLVNAGTWGLMLTGRLVALEAETRRDPLSLLGRLAARGPHYLARFASEQCVTVNTAALGGSTELLSLAEEGRA